MKKLVLLGSLFCLSACKYLSEVPAGDLIYLQIGDSITAGQGLTTSSPGHYAAAALATPTTFIKLGWPGENAAQFLTQHEQKLLDTLATIPAGHRQIVGVAYGTNDLNTVAKERVLANILRTVYWLRDTAGIKEILVIPVLNRQDKWGFTIEADGARSQHFNYSRRWLNAELRAKLAGTPEAHIADEADSPAMYADEYPQNNTLCADEVHPTDAGAELLGIGTIAHGIASFRYVKLK